ncbi:MAG: hypothetical protein HFH84_18515 [Lachnospiraceae bacterium]|nr:hypothetical protein [Lachnospiraceae bacterium]
MRKLTVMKSMSKTIFAVCIALSILVCNSVTASAAKCETHSFTKSRPTGEEYYSTEGTHMHLFGTDENGKEYYKACALTYHYKYYVKICEKCHIELDGSRYVKVESISHRFLN